MTDRPPSHRNSSAEDEHNSGEIPSLHVDREPIDLQSPYNGGHVERTQCKAKSRVCPTMTASRSPVDSVLSKSILLSRLPLTGAVGMDTPLVVITEIADAHGISYNLDYLEDQMYIRDLIIMINNRPVPRSCPTIQDLRPKEPSRFQGAMPKVVQVSNPEMQGISQETITDQNEINTVRSFSPDNYRQIARYVNDTVNWDADSLITAFDYLVGFFDKSVLQSIRPDFSYGKQTPDDPYLLNACVIYSACRFHGIKCDFDTTGLEMSNALRTYMMCDSFDIRDRIISLLTRDNSSKIGLLNALVSLESFANEYHPDHPTLQREIDPSKSHHSSTDDSSRLEEPSGIGPGVALSMITDSSYEMTIDEHTDANVFQAAGSTEAVEKNIDQQNEEVVTTFVQEPNVDASQLLEEPIEGSALESHSEQTLHTFNPLFHHQILTGRKIDPPILEIEDNSGTSTSDSNASVRFIPRRRSINRPPRESNTLGHNAIIASAHRISSRTTKLGSGKGRGTQLHRTLLNQDVGVQVRRHLDSAMNGQMRRDGPAHIPPESRRTLGSRKYRPRQRKKIDFVIDQSINSKGPTYNELSESATTIRDFLGRSSENNLFNIRSYADVVAAAAVIYKIDITGVADPVSEFRSLQETPYIPNDKGLSERLNKMYQEVYSPYLDVVFNPNLPRAFYTVSQLRGHTLNEGYTVADITNVDLYELLQVSHLSTTFLHGKLPNIENECTNITFEDIDDLDIDAVVCHGIISDRLIRENKESPRNTLHAYTYDELFETFSIYKVFQDPASVQNKFFNDREISKLMALATHDIRPGESDENYDTRKRLSRQIGYIRTITRGIGKEACEFRSMYQTSTSSKRKEIDRMIWAFHAIAMNMRGWLGVGPYPIAKACVDNQAIVDVRVSDGIGEFEQLCQSLGEIGALFLRLPLVRYRNHTFVRSNDKTDGLTILDRLNIVKQGDTGFNIASCIRITSNWFASTVHRYMTILEIDPKFDITLLREIA